MTPEELNRTIEFIVQSQARLAAAQEQDREDRIQFEEESRALDRRLAKVFEIQTHLLEDQSRLVEEHRQMLERHDQMLEGQTELLKTEGKRFKQYEEENRAAQNRHDQLMNEIRTTLKLILDKLPDRLN